MGLSASHHALSFSQSRWCLGTARGWGPGGGCGPWATKVGCEITMGEDMLVIFWGYPGGLMYIYIYINGEMGYLFRSRFFSENHVDEMVLIYIYI